MGDTCNNTAQMAGYLTTGTVSCQPLCLWEFNYFTTKSRDIWVFTSVLPEPCVPMNLSVRYNVSTAQVMWGAAKGATSYSVQAVTDQGLTVTCNTTDTSCPLNGLQCSQIYNVTVMAHNQACNSSVISAPYRLMTGLSPNQDELCNRIHRVQVCRFNMCLFPLFQSPAHPPAFKPAWRVNSLLRQFPGSWATSPWVMLRTLTTSMDTRLPVLAHTQIRTVLCQDWCVAQCTASGSRLWGSSTTALTATCSHLHQVKTYSGEILFSPRFFYICIFGAHALMFSFLSSLSAKRGGGKGQL